MQTTRAQPNEIANAGPRESPPGLNLSVESDSQEIEDEAAENKLQRQDLFVCFTNDKDLRHHETISIKASLYKGIAVRVKILNHIWMENILFSIETAGDLGIVNLRFEECRILKKAVVRLIEFFKTTNIIESLGLVKTTFDDTQDFKRLVEAVQLNRSIKQFAVNYADFNEDFYGKTFAKCVLESQSLKELDMSHIHFREQKSFYEMANGLLNERCQLGALKLRGISFNHLEGQVMQFILTKNQSLQTLDISQCSTESPEILEKVFLKFDESCTIKTLVVENSDTDFNHFLEAFGEALGQNTHLEGLSLKENALKQTQYCSFWDLMSENRSLKKMNLQKTDVTNKVCQRLGQYLMKPGIILQDLNLCKNSIEAEGLIALSQALHVNTSILKLNLAQNLIQDGGLEEFVSSLKVNKTLKELCLSLNKINNTGLEAFSGFLATNKTLTVLDLSKNQFSDFGFVHFAKQLAYNKGIESLNLQRNKDVTDDVGLRELAQALAVNASLAIIDLSGLKIRKPCIIQYFQPALQSNITLKKILGKIPPGIIADDLKDNVTIEADITNKYKTVKSSSKRQHSLLPLNQHQGEYTYLDLSNSANELLTPALKFIRYRCIHGVNLSNMQLEDESLRLLSLYLEENPILRSLALADNYFTDDGLGQLILALRSNTHLNHLDIQGCNLISSLSIKALGNMVTEVNMSLYGIEIERDQFDPGLVKSVLTQARYNKAIQMHLKPTKLFNDDGLIEIKFVQGASIAEFFDAALKSWRIMGPTMIKAVNEELEDSHIEQLCEFLSYRNLIKSLNLRRNKIGNKGAIAIANFIRKADKTLQILELERNQIQDEGGEELLRATQANMRIERCNMSFGNPMRQKICRQIEREIQANLQIKAQVAPVYKSQRNSLQKYEESDRGPDFARCALKSCELFKILHLSLPDNMIGLKEVIDISYVLAKNTPLRTLNLSQNAIDAKAALILSEGFAANSYLREVDLRQNILEDSGIAVLLRPFIMQKLDRFSVRNEGVSRFFQQGKQNAIQSVGYEIPTLLKMKIERLQLDQNNQTAEALKHVYTTLIINEEIEISIDLPEQIPIDIDERSVDTVFGPQDSSSSDDSDVDDKKDASPKSPKKDMSPSAQGSVLPIQKQGTSVSKNLSQMGSSRNLNTSLQISKQKTISMSRQQSFKNKGGQDKFGQKDPFTQIVEKPEQGDELKQPGIKLVVEDMDPDTYDDPDSFVDMAQLPEPKKAVPFICRLKCCSRCRKLKYRDPNKPKKTCIQLCCPSFFENRASANRFQMSQDLLKYSETNVQIKIFYALVTQIGLFLVFGLMIPLLLRNDEERCQPFMPIQVYICYLAFIVASSIIEIKIFKQMNMTLKKSEQAASKCNSYTTAKGIQGQMANLSTFIQVGFCAHIISCNKGHDHSLREEIEDLVQSAAWQQAASHALAIMAGVIITVSNYQRFMYIFTYWKPQPHIHTVLPNTYRNIQFAWLCNMQSVAIILESTSLSEYMNELGGPITKNKPKEDIDPAVRDKLIVKSISEQLVRNRLNFQDLPMVLVLVVHFLTHVNVLTDFDMIVFAVKIGIVGFSSFSSYLSYKWQRNPKRVDYKLIQEIIDQRIKKRVDLEESIKKEEADNLKVDLTYSNETKGSADIDLLDDSNEKAEGQKKEDEEGISLKDSQNQEGKSKIDDLSSDLKESFENDSILSRKDDAQEQ